MIGKSKDKKPQGSAGKPEAITAEGNALRQITLKALLIAIVPLVLGFAFLALVREPLLQHQQLERVADAYARQQATNIHHVLLRISARIKAAATAPDAVQSIASGAAEDIARAERAMLAYFPEVTSLSLTPLDDMGTATFARSSDGLRNHIELDLLRRTGQGETTLPESYEFEGRWLTSIARLVSHPEDPSRRAVILATFDNTLINGQLSGMGVNVGRFALEQVFGGKATVIASTGQAAPGEDSYSYAIPESHWQVSFTPSPELVDTLTINKLPLLVVLAAIAVAVIAGFAVIVFLWPARLAQEVETIISAAERKTPITLAVPELVPLAKQLRRASLRTLRQGASGSATPTVQFAEAPDPGMDNFANPLFQANSILDEEEGLDLDLDSSAAAPAPPDEVDFPNHIFRAYDIRGLADTELNDEIVAKIGGAIGTLAKEKGEQTLVVGCDGRNSSARIKATLIKALADSGRDIIDIGLVPTPLLYFATRHLNCGSGVMVTGSHNPADYNGLKIVLNQHTIAAGGIQDIRERAQQGKFSKGHGRMIREDVVDSYVDEVLSDIAIAMPLKIVIDAGNGTTSRIAPALFEELGCEVVPLYCEIDGNFPNHSPDTSNEDNLADLAAAVRAESADFGVAFDGDGDRLAIVSSSGRIVRSDSLLMVFAQDVVSRNPGADVVFDVKCSRNLAQLITRNGGRPVLWKTGHAFMKEKMIETGALLGGEFSGHMFFGERWYGFDDGMYAAARLAEILSTHGEALDDVLAKFPASVSTPEIIIPVAEDRKFRLIEDLALTGRFSHGKVNHLDGVRVDFADGWGLVRASNTSAALTARFEAESEDALNTIKQEFRSQLAEVDPQLELTF